MKKIFSLALMATALLISGQVNAATKNFTVGGATGEADLRAAFAAADAGDVVNITLTSNIDLTGTAGLVIGTQGGADAEESRTINLNLGGKNLTSSAAFTMIRVNKGVLNVSNGTMEYLGTDQNIKVIDIYGSKSKNDSAYSVVNIAKDARIIGKWYCIVITELKVGTHVYDPTPAGDYEAAYGTILNVDGYVYGGKYGIKVNGPIRGEGNNIPMIIVGATAEVACAPDSKAEGFEKASTACYSSGVGNWYIYGYVHGNIGLTVKGGNVEIEDATITGQGDEYKELVAGGSGMNGGAGCGILIVSQKNYPGDQEVTIKGDSKITANGGFAISETVPKNDTTKSSTASLVIEGGTITGGEMGAMVITEEAGTNKVVTVYGGTVSSDTVKVGDITVKLDDLKAPNTFVTPVPVGSDTVYVVSTGTKPSETPVKLSAATAASVIIAEGHETINKNLTLGYVQMTNATSDTIAKGYTVKIDKLVMGDDAQLVVMPGAKLLVMGEQGIVAGQTSNIVIKADSTGMGTFAFNPAVTSNRHPFATVEYYTVAGKYSTLNYYTGVSCPFYALDTIYMADEPGCSSSYAFLKMNDTKTKWVNFSSRDDLKNMNAFQMVLTRPANEVGTKATYVWKGQLQGNNSGELKLEKGFNYIGNAYLAEMNAAQMINVLKNSGVKVRSIVYTWYMPNSGYKFHSGNSSELTILKPMEGFVLYADEDCTIDLNYNELIWNQVIQ